MTSSTQPTCDHPEDQLGPLPYEGKPANPNEWECGACGYWEIADVVEEVNPIWATNKAYSFSPFTTEMEQDYPALKKAFENSFEKAYMGTFLPRPREFTTSIDLVDPWRGINKLYADAGHPRMFEWHMSRELLYSLRRADAPRPWIEPQAQGVPQQVFGATVRLVFAPPDFVQIVIT